MSKRSVGFDSDYNEVLLIDGDGSVFYPRLRKTELSRQLISKISQKIKMKNKQL